MCRHSYSLSHKKSEKMFWIVTWPTSHRFRDKRLFPSKIANFSHPCVVPAGIGYRPRARQSFNPAVSESLFILQNYAEPYKIYLVRPELSWILAVCMLQLSPRPPSRLGRGWNLVSWFSGESLKSLPPKCQILRLKCIKIDFGLGSAPDPAGRAYSAPHTP